MAKSVPSLRLRSIDNPVCFPTSMPIACFRAVTRGWLSASGASERSDRLTPGESRFDLVPVEHLVLVHLPAKIDLAVMTQGAKVQQSCAQVLYLNTGVEDSRGPGGPGARTRKPGA